jgi:hypothetical protein
MITTIPTMHLRDCFAPSILCDRSVPLLAG